MVEPGPNFFSILARRRRAPDAIDLDLLTLACERDRVLLFRMSSSFLARVGEPRRITVVSDGSLAPATVTALRRLSARIEVVPHEDVMSSDWVPEVVRRLARNHVFGIKLALAFTRLTPIVQ